MASRSAGVGGPSPRTERSPMAVTRDVTSTPKRARSCRASAPSATVVAVDRALARSSASRASSKPYFCTPGRSAWPGRGRVKRGPPRDAGDMRSFQFSWSLFQTTSAMGVPSVTPPRIPERNWARSVSICMRPPRP